MLPATSWVLLIEARVSVHQLTSAQVLREEDEIRDDFPILSIGQSTTQSYFWSSSIKERM